MVGLDSRRGVRLGVASMLIAATALASDHGSAQQTQLVSATKTRLVQGDELLGEWWTQGNEGRIRITRDRDGTFRGTTTCCVPAKPTQDHPAQDIHNPNPERRPRSTVGIVIIWKLKYEGDGEYVDGYVYNPRDGKTYRIDMQVVDRNTVKIRGYLAIPLLGQSQIWKRVGPAANAEPTTAAR
jgi:uncharacterized protein (DUF2147 family)